jgi:uncharacterized membrane protein
MEEKTMLSTLLTLLVVGVLALAVLGIVFMILGVAFGILFKLLPIVLIGYVVLRLLAPRQKKLSEADRKWLES